MAKFKRNNLLLKTNQKIQLGTNQESDIKYDGSNLLLNPSSGGDTYISLNESAKAISLNADATSTLVVNAGTSKLDITELDVVVKSGNLDVGVDASRRGLLTLFGDGTGSTVGGKIRLHLNDDDAGSLQWYEIRVDGSEFLITPNLDDPDSAFKFDGSQWVFASGGLNLGINDQVGGTLSVLGRGTGQQLGGSIRLFPSFDYTTPFWYNIEVWEDDLRIGLSGGADDSLTYHGGTGVWEFNNTAGVKLTTGATVNEFSTDGTLAGDSDTAVPTEKAIRTYVDAQIGLGIETGNTFMSTADTTANITFIQAQGSFNYAIGYSIINEVDNPPLLFVSGIFEKRLDGFRVMLSSPVDTDNYYISWVVGDTLLGSSSSSSSRSSSSSSLSSSSSSSSRSSSSSSRSSSSRSSSSSSSAGVSISSSSTVAVASYLSGFPEPPDYIEVTIGTRWKVSTGLTEDEVINLYQASANSWTEDGTTTAHPTNNRLMMRWDPNVPHNVIAGRVYTSYYGGTFADAWVEGFNITATPTYTFADVWSANLSVNLDAAFMTVVGNYPIQTNVFKTFTYVSGSSSSSRSSSSTSVSSSSNSDAVFMGTGWPYLPDTMEVVIGTRWNEPFINFVEDDVLTLKRYGQDGSNITYTEDGTLTGNASTNRLRINYRQNGTSLYLNFRVANTNTAGFLASVGQFFNVAFSFPYDFKELWDLSPSWTAYVAQGGAGGAGYYFTNITYYSSFSPALQYNDEIFKSITFIDN